MPRKGENPYRRFAIYSSIIVLIPATLLGAFYLGYVLDGQLGTWPWLTLAGLFIGVAGVFLQLFKLIR